MARFLYFVRGFSGPSSDALPESHHVRKVLAGASPEVRGCTAGPDGEAGSVIMAGESSEGEDGERATVCGFYPHRQTWVDCGEFWLGWETENQPGPSDLLRPKPVGGEAVELGDGNEWTVPLLGPAWQEMPKYIRRAAGGCEAVLRDEFKAVCKESEYWFDVLRAAEDYPLSRFFAFAVDALACNYRLGQDEAGALKLIGTEAEVNSSLLAAAVGLRRAMEELKKKRRDGGPSEPDGK